MAGLSYGLWQRVAPGPLDEDRLHRWVNRLPPGERRAFFAALLLIDRKVTVTGLVEGWAHVPTERPPAPVPPVVEVSPLGRQCLTCGKELVQPSGSKGGRPFWYCSVECRNVPKNEAQRRKRASN